MDTPHGTKLLREVATLAGPLTSRETGAIAGEFLSRSGIDEAVIAALMHQLTEADQRALVEHTTCILGV